MRTLLIALLIAGCGKEEPKHEPLPSPDDIAVIVEQTESRLIEMSEPRGWVVSRWADGRVEHTGDSLLWSGMAMGVLDCERGAVTEAALLAMLDETGGTVYRHPYEAAREPSLDGHLGLYWGIAHRVARCPETADVWREAMRDFEPLNVPLPFHKVLAAVRYQLGLGLAPSGTATLSDAVAAWAYGVVLTKAAGYRIHLGLLSLQTLETSGAGLPAAARSKFCAASKGADMPTVDHWCGRGDLPAWIASFRYDVYEYRHQRARWESPDGKDVLATPALDLLVAAHAAFEN